MSAADFRSLDEAEDDERVQWQDMPWRGKTLKGWFIALGFLVAVTSFLGLLVVGPLDGSIGAFDRDVSRAANDMRTDAWNDATNIGSTSADSIVKIPAILILCGLFLWRWIRWKEAAFLAGALALESAAFVIASFIVDRSRPAIEQLDSIPPTGSFPSGHTAAAVTFYGALAVIVFWRTQNRPLRFMAATVAVVMAPIVAFSRVYRGMHFLSDVVVGGLLGLAALIISVELIQRHYGRTRSTAARNAD